MNFHYNYKYLIFFIVAVLSAPQSILGQCCNEDLGFDEIDWGVSFQTNRYGTCSCGVGQYRRYGMIIEFWEPVRVIDTVSTRWCSPARAENIDPLIEMEPREGTEDFTNPNINTSDYGVEGEPDINPDTAGTGAGRARTSTNLDGVLESENIDGGDLWFNEVGTENTGEIADPNAGDLLNGVGNPMDLSGLLSPNNTLENLANVNPGAVRPTTQGRTMQNGISDLAKKGNINSNNRGKGKGDLTFLYAHMYTPLDIMGSLTVNDMRCVQSSQGNPIDYISEVDAAWESPSIASLLDLVLVMPIFLMLFAGDEEIVGDFTTFDAVISQCFADAVSSQFGLPNEFAYFFLGAWGFKYPLNGTVSNEDYSSANAVAAVRAAEIGAQSGRILDTTIDLCSASYFPLLIKNNFRLQQIRPVNRHDQITIGESSALWGVADNPIIGECKDNYSWVLWRRRICCGYI
jgi:hypothetical protein